MKRLLRNRFGGTIDETIGAIFGISLALLTFWGIGWSFYRHGMVHGAIAVFVPPYAWYRGVAAIWDKPAWKEHYDVRTEQLAVVITNSLNNDPNYQFQSREFIHDLKGWVRHVPQSERQQLREASRNFGLAMTEYCQRYLLSALDGEAHPHPEQSGAIQERVAGFQRISGFSTAWQHMLRDANSLDDVLTSIKRGDTDPNLRLDDTTPQDRPRVENGIRALIQAMNSKIEGTINDIFSES